MCKLVDRLRTRTHSANPCHNQIYKHRHWFRFNLMWPTMFFEFCLVPAQFKGPGSTFWIHTNSFMDAPVSSWLFLACLVTKTSKLDGGGAQHQFEGIFPSGDRTFACRGQSVCWDVRLMLVFVSCPLKGENTAHLSSRRVKPDTRSSAQTQCVGKRHTDTKCHSLLSERGFIEKIICIQLHSVTTRVNLLRQ